MSEMSCLIVDDSRMSRMMITKILANAHPEWLLVEAADGQQAIEKAAEREFDIILLDYNMPVMDGGQAAEQLRPMFPDAKISLLTANVQESIINLAKQLKIDFIPKPITEEKVLTYVNRK